MFRSGLNLLHAVASVDMVLRMHEDKLRGPVEVCIPRVFRPLLQSLRSVAFPIELGFADKLLPCPALVQTQCQNFGTFMRGASRVLSLEEQLQVAASLRSRKLQFGRQRCDDISRAVEVGLVGGEFQLKVAADVVHFVQAKDDVSAGVT